MAASALPRPGVNRASERTLEHLYRGTRPCAHLYWRALSDARCTANEDLLGMIDPVNVPGTEPEYQIGGATSRNRSKDIAARGDSLHALLRSTGAALIP